MRTVDEWFAQPRAAHWSIGDCLTTEGWLVTGGNLFHARGRTQAEA